MEDIIVMLHDKGLSLAESVWVLQQVFGESLAKLKEVVTAHPVWAELVSCTEPLHDELENLERAIDGQGNGQVVDGGGARAAESG